MSSSSSQSHSSSASATTTSKNSYVVVSDKEGISVKNNNTTSTLSGIEDIQSTITPNKEDVIMDVVEDDCGEEIEEGSSGGGSNNNGGDVGDGGSVVDGEERKDVVMEDGDHHNNNNSHHHSEGGSNGKNGEAKPNVDEGISKSNNPLDALMEAIEMKTDKQQQAAGEEVDKRGGNQNDSMDVGEAEWEDDTTSNNNTKNDVEECTDEKDEEGEKTPKIGNVEKKSDPVSTNTTTTTAATETNVDSTDKSSSDNATEPPVVEPILTGILAYSDRDNLRRHIIRGNWKFSHSPDATPQRFELIRIIPPDEDLTELPKDGEFNGSFNVQTHVKTSKMKIKIKNRAVPENGVMLTFTPKEKEEAADDGNDAEAFTVFGRGTNEFGVFELHGTATKNKAVEEGDDPTYSISVRKVYVFVPPPPGSVADAAVTDASVPPPAAVLTDKSKHGNGSKKRNHSDAMEGDDSKQKPLPPPPTVVATEGGGICLHGKLVRNTSDELSLDNAAVHRISGVWGMEGLSKILDDPEKCERFEFEHKCSGDSTVFPLSGRYTGFFYTNNLGERTKNPERDVTLKFIMNSEGYYNVEGRGSNVYGKYSITGTLKDSTITLHRVYQALKEKSSKKSVHVKLSAPSSDIPKDGAGFAVQALPLLTFDDVDYPKDGTAPPPFSPPEQFSAQSRGILKIDSDGAHTCTGNWALSERDFEAGLVAKYHFGISSNNAVEDAEVMLKASSSASAKNDDVRQFEIAERNGNVVSPVTLAHSTFPIDSTSYRGSFKLRKGTKTQSFIDNQIVLKYVKNTSGYYNVYGKGTNDMGKFDIVGTLIPQGKGYGSMRLYRIYLPQPVDAMPIAQFPIGSKKSGKVFQGGLTEKATSANSGPAPAMKPPERFIPSMSGLQRQSSRMPKLPSRLEEDDPEAKMGRLMSRCRDILQELIDSDVHAIFTSPVDPVALGIPTYFDIIENPMDLGTVKTKLENNEIDSPIEFARLVRLTFENAILFNNLPTNDVHIQARNFMASFTKKFGIIDKEFVAAKKNKTLTKAERQELRQKEKEAAKEAKRQLKKEKERKRKAEEEASNESKRMKLEHVLTTNKSTMAAIAQAAPDDPDATVSRAEYNLLVRAIKEVQDQIVGLHKLVKKSSKSAATPSDVIDTQVAAPIYAPAEPSYQSMKPKKKKPKKTIESRSPSPQPKSYPTQAPVVDEPLSFEEQEALSEAINLLPEWLLPGAMQIIREADFVNDDDDEVDLDLDQLDTITQRKLQSYVMEVRFG